VRSTEVLPSSVVQRLAVCGSILLFMVFSPMQLKAQPIYKVLYSFTGGADGGQPLAGVVFDKAGNLYGTAELNGAHGQGTVFQLVPSQGSWTFNLVYTFTGGTDGGVPFGGVIVDSAGNLYGTVSGGGDPFCQCGTVFELTPSQSGWTFKVLHSFIGGNDGAYPGAGLAFTSFNSRLEGTTVHGGRYGFGTAFSLPLTGGQDSVSPLKGSNGSQPWASLLGSVGTSYAGGKTGMGEVFQLIGGTLIKGLHSFDPAKPFGVHPQGNLVSDSSNNLYGTTYSGGVGHGGTVFKMYPSPYGPTYIFSVVYSFSGPDGAGSTAGLVFDASGNLYGTTAFGGADPNRAGTVFKLTPGAKNKWTETLLHSFTGGSDGWSPYSGLAIDGANNLYGTTIMGGATGHGVVFQITP
jgi:uncharacterized repeat protein (TIGR03803 family)